MPSRADTPEDALREFIDNRVWHETGFSSAQELLGSVPRLPLLWAFAGGALALWLLFWLGGSAGPGGLLLLPVFVFVGYVAALIAYGAVGRRIIARYSGRFDGMVDADDLLAFLNERLDYLRPYFHEWGYRNLSDSNFIFEDADARDRTWETVICSPFGSDERRIAELTLRPDLSNEGTGGTEYSVDAENTVEGPWFVSRDMGFQKYRCLARIAPVLSAVMDFYLRDGSATETGRERR